jgi:hypothetical protein
MYENLKGQLADYQHRFVKGRSTVSNLLEYSSLVLKSIEDGCQVDSIYKDFSKMSTDVEPTRCQWLGSYFSGNRFQCVRMGACVSRDILVTSFGFIWFVDEISRNFRHVRVLFYADNMKLILPVRGIRDGLKIQSDLNRLAEWCEPKALELNVSKCKSISFSRLRHPIEFSYMLGGIILNGQQDVFYGWKGFGDAGVCEEVVV